jgi:MoxR-like ATPase
MKNEIYRGWNQEEFGKAGFTDLIELLPNKGGNHLYFPKWIIEVIVEGICTGEFIHVSGPSGSAKSALIEAMMIEQNFASIVASLQHQVKPIIIFPIEMAKYETPGEFIFRRSLKNGTTFDEKSELVDALYRAQELRETHYVVIWLREMGRVHSSNVQGGLLNLMSKSELILGENRTLSGRDICWIADSNYQAESDANFTLVQLDTALQRRFSVNVTIDYLEPELEFKILSNIIEQDTDLELDHGLIWEAVKLGTAIRSQRSLGNLLSVPPPTIYGYLSYYKMVKQLNNLSHKLIAKVSLLGHANTQDQKYIPLVFNEVYSYEMQDDDKETIAPNLF